ncbi:MAG: hypothetical protein ABI833_10055 [Acidobacteriota bacterium]
MTPDEIRKLLGGYAIGTLTDEERNLLFSAALEDQELFDLMADEEVLRELLAEPATRQALVAALQRQTPLGAPSPGNQRGPQESAETFWARMWQYLTPRRLAFAGGLAVLLLTAGGIQYWRSHAPGPEPVTVAVLRTPGPNASSAREAESSVAPPARANEPVAKRIPRSAAVPSLDSRQESDRGLADGNRPQARSMEQGQANQRIDETRAAAPLTAGRKAEESGKQAEQRTANSDAAREQLNQAVRDRIAQAQPADSVASESAAAGPAETKTTRSAPEGKPQAAPLTPAQIVAGGLRPAAPPSAAAAGALFANKSRQLEAKVTDLNGTIVSINIGSNSGLKAGDVIEILRERRVIATSRLSQVGATFAVGPLQPVAGADSVRSGDPVRRVVPSLPQR